MQRSFALFFSVSMLATSTGLVACSSSSSSPGGSGSDCTSLCTAAQAGNCTAIKGDCATFCSALGTVTSEASCSPQYNAYDSCLGTPATVCSTMCGAQQLALKNCLTPYCAAHSTEASCTTVASSF